jgi:hypothetical protein
LGDFIGSKIGVYGFFLLLIGILISFFNFPIGFIFGVLMTSSGIFIIILGSLESMPCEEEKPKRRRRR